MASIAPVRTQKRVFVRRRSQHIHTISWWCSYEKLNMKLALALVVVISTWGTLMVAATSSEITKPKPKPPPPPPPPSFPPPQTMPGFDLAGSNGASYSEYIGGLRAKLADSKRSYCEVPMIKLSPSLQYMYVELESGQGNSITLAIRMNDLYVDGYSYKYQGQLRARFLKPTDTTIKANLFKDAKNDDKDIGYGGSYQELEKNAGLLNGKGRQDPSVALGMPRLDTYINEITHKDPIKQRPEFIKIEARLLLIVIQMVSEAIRFTYIENKIKDNFFTGYIPDSTAIDLELNWAKITKAMQKNDCFRSEDMGLLKYLDSSSLAWPMIQPVDNVTVWAQ